MGKYTNSQGTFIDCYLTYRPVINEIIWNEGIRYKILNVKPLHPHDYRRHDYVLKVEEIKEI